MKPYFSLLAVALFIFGSVSAQALTEEELCVIKDVQQSMPDTQNQKIIRNILDRKAQFVARAKAGDQPLDFYAFMDFDGTIIDGDVTEGLKDRYAGLAEEAIRAGLCPPEFQGPGGFEKYEAKYHEIYKQSGTQAAYTFTAETFAHLSRENQLKLDQLVSSHWKTTLHNHLFSSSMEVMKALQDSGIHVVIISASPQNFVEGAASYVNVPKNLIFGINRTRLPNGALVDPVVTYGSEKIEKIQQVINASSQNSSTPVVLAGFGNSWGTDGPFLNWIAQHHDGMSVMINGGKAPNESHLLFEVQQTNTVSSSQK